MKKLLLFILPISVIIAGVLWYSFGFDGMVMTIGTVLSVILFFVFLSCSESRHQGVTVLFSFLLFCIPAC